MEIAKSVAAQSAKHVYKYFHARPSAWSVSRRKSGAKVRPATQPKFGLVVRLYFIAWVIWLIDFATKTWAIANLDPRDPIELIGSFLQLLAQLF